MSDAERCERCNDSINKGHAFCTLCGRPTGVNPREGSLTAAARIVGLFIMFTCLAVLFFEVYTIFWGMGEIWSNIGDYMVSIMVITPSPAALVWLSGGAAKAYYLFLVVATVASFVMLLYASRGGLKDLLRRKTDKLNDMPLYSVTTLFAATISFNIIFIIIIMSSGITMEVPEFDDTWIDWYGLLNASVWEEVLCRLCMIGIPMAILGLLMKEKKSWKCLFGRFEMSGAAVVFIIISSLVFGLAHLQGWDVYKIIPTFVTGLAFGYLFVKYGIYASIMLHFLVDYSSSFIWVLGDITGEALSVLFIFGMAVLGIVFLVRYTIHGFNFMKRTVSEIKKPPETVP